jgi:hypothetical protein
LDHCIGFRLKEEEKPEPEKPAEQPAEQPKEKSKIKNIDLEEPMKVTVPKPLPKLVDYDSDDSERTISDIVTLPAKPVKQVQPVKPVEPVKPFEAVKAQTVKVIRSGDDFTNVIVKDEVEVKEPIVKDIPAPTLNPEVSFLFYKNPMPSIPARKPVDLTSYTTTFPARKPVVFTSSVTTSDLKAKECSICKRVTFLNKVKDYLNIIDNSIGNFQISLIVEMFEFIDKNFDYINTKEFDLNKKLVLAIHTKALSLQEELDYKIKCTNPQYTNDIAMFNNAKKLLERVHTKCHLYGMEKFVTDDPIYKKFLDTFINQYVQL